MGIVKSLALFILAGLFEIGGGYLVWLSLKEGRPWWYGLGGGIVLALYGVVATWQTANFGRVYATYGGIFILWAFCLRGKLRASSPINGILLARWSPSRAPVWSFICQESKINTTCIFIFFILSSPPFLKIASLFNSYAPFVTRISPAFKPDKTDNNFELAIAVAWGLRHHFGRSIRGGIAPLVEVPALVVLINLAFWLRRKYLIRCFSLHYNAHMRKTNSPCFDIKCLALSRDFTS